ncbi:MAG: hypothetical protein JXA44_00190 [Methanospirillaceae archaeon]|nr:hypothetical protein [Methanospirillaceae archaeon]
MKNSTIYLLIVALSLFIVASACISQPSGPSGVGEDVTRTDVTEGMASSEVSVEGAVIPEYYYNIQIISPSMLDDLKFRIKDDARLITDEQDVLIGIVTPKTLYLRGDLYEIRGESSADDTLLTKKDISNHLIDIAFGLDNSKISKWKTDKDYKFWFDANYNNNDIAYVISFAKIFNGISETTQIKDDSVERGFLQTNYAKIPYNYYNIRIIPFAMLEEFKDKRSSSDKLIRDDDGRLIGMVNLDYLYLRNDLTTEEREHYLQKGILWSLGFHGNTYDIKDSYFYPKYTGGNILTDIDKEAIRIMYGGKIKPGMDLDETKVVLGLKN